MGTIDEKVRKNKKWNEKKQKNTANKTPMEIRKRKIGHPVPLLHTWHTRHTHTHMKKNGRLHTREHRACAQQLCDYLSAPPSAPEWIAQGQNSVDSTLHATKGKQEIKSSLCMALAEKELRMTTRHHLLLEYDLRS